MNVLKQNTFWRRTISMKNYNELSDEQLVETIKENDCLEARDVLLKRFGNMIFSIVGRNFISNTIGYASRIDAVETAEASLINAAVKYDCEKGTKFSTYAWECIDGETKNYIKNYRSLVLTSAMHRRSNMLLKVIAKSKKSGLFPEDKNICDIVRDCREQLINFLKQEYPKENWDKFIDETSLISTLSENSMDKTIGESNETKYDIVRKDRDMRKKFILSLEQRIMENEGADAELLLKEARNAFKNIYVYWMNKMILLFCGKRRVLVYDCLKKYYINFEDKSVIITRLNSMGYNGDDYLRQNRSRFEKSISKINASLLCMMINELNKYFDSNFEYLTKEGSQRVNFGEFCKIVRNWMLSGEES